MQLCTLYTPWRLVRFKGARDNQAMCNALYTTVLCSLLLYVLYHIVIYCLVQYHMVIRLYSIMYMMQCFMAINSVVET